MKEPEYTEGPEATENFEEGMKTLFKAPKAAIVQAKKRKPKDPSLPSLKKQKKSDKD